MARVAVIRNPKFLILLVALLHGLVYVFVVPPWQHYDEPNHFEYVWLAANHPGWPQAGDYDQGMRRATAESMLAHGFFDDKTYRPDLDPPPGQATWIGPYPQLGDPPLYYLLASLPLRALRQADITLQLYAARLVSLGLFLVTVLAAWGVTAEITPSGHLLRLLVPAVVALLPGFADLMTAVNNDAAAVAFLSLSLWGSLRLVKRGLAPLPLTATALAVTAAMLSKETAYLALPLFGLALVLAVLRGRWRWLAWAVIGIGGIAVLVAAISWGDAAAWQRSTAQGLPTRGQNVQAVHGASVFQLQADAPLTPRWLAPLFQPVPAAAHGRVYTLGCWMWASQPVETAMPTLSDGRRIYSEKITLGETPSFYTFTVSLDDEKFSRMWVTLDPSHPSPGENVIVYYDGLVLVEGSWPANIPPQFSGADASEGVWNGMPFVNLLRNASAERSGPRFRAWADELGARVLPNQSRPSLLLTSLLDWRATGWFYQASSATLLRTFWAKFGWGNVALLGHKPYRLLLVVTVLGLLGAGIGAARRLRRRSAFPWDTLALLAFVFVGAWGAAAIRGAIYLSLLQLFVPVARYAYPAIIPTILILAFGWLECLSLLGKRQPEWLKPAILLGLFAILDVYALWSIVRYFRA